MNYDDEEADIIEYPMNPQKALRKSDSSSDEEEVDDIYLEELFEEEGDSAFKSGINYEPLGISLSKDPEYQAIIKHYEDILKSYNP